MKSVQSIADLKDHALRTGSSVELGGSRFNTERTRVNPQSLRAPAGVSGVHAAPPAADPMQGLVMALVAKQLAEAQSSDGKGFEAAAERIGAAIVEAMAKAQQPQVTVQAAAAKDAQPAPRKWTFTVKRSADGALETITATAG